MINFFSRHRRKIQWLKYEGRVKPYHLLCLSLVLPTFISCSNTLATYNQNTRSLPHPEFTSKNVFDLRPGMLPKEIENKFGLPDRTTIRTMGRKTQDPWPSLIYYYDMKKDRIGRFKYIIYTNTFYFVTDVQPPLLRSWELELIYPERK